MRHENCLTCRYLAMTGAPERVLTAIAESISPDMHHHHVVRCEECGSWWFDDITIGGLGIPVASRRDTTMCPCPEDGSVQYRQVVMQVPVPEDECKCDRAEVRKHATVDIRLGGG